MGAGLRGWPIALALSTWACACGGSGAPDADADADAGHVDGGRDAGARDAGGADADTPTPDAGARDAGGADAGGADAGIAPALEVTALGVQGFVLSYAGVAVLSAPLFTRQSTLGVTLGLPLDADVAAIDAGLADVDLGGLRAVVSGHAHYDHLMDVPRVLALAPEATLYANRSAQHILAALAPDRDDACEGDAPDPSLERARVVALDAVGASRVDYTHCPDLRPLDAPVEGEWVAVPGGAIRLMAVCTTHPPQIGPVHFGEGSVDEDLCELPAAANGWLEGRTLSFLIDFLDDRGAPAFRVYYQDAPATAPVGEVPAALLAERRVDLAILCVGSNDSVEDQPTDIIRSLDPRFVFSGHWEDFFIPRDEPPRPILLLDVDRYVARAEAELTDPPDAPLRVDGSEVPGRHVLIQPGARLWVPPPP